MGEDTLNCRRRASYKNLQNCPTQVDWVISNLFYDDDDDDDDDDDKKTTIASDPLQSI